MSKQLMDDAGKPIPVCNVLDETRHMHLYVEDPNSFATLQKDVSNSKMLTLMAGAVLAVFLAIFSLNLTAAGWTLGNILTFALIIVCLYVLTLYGKKWMVGSATISQLVRQGYPCSTDMGNDSKMIYCKR